MRGGRARAAAQWAKGKGVVVGCSAAAMHGVPWIDAERPVELARAGHTKPPCGIVTVRDCIESREICEIDGYRVTTPARTAFDIGRRLPRDEAIPLMDALCRATRTLPREVGRVVEAHPGARGTRLVAAMVPLIDGGAQSLQESLTRLMLIDDGLPVPTTQIAVRDRDTGFLAYIDMGWPKWRVGVEYDGGQHWTDAAQHAKDIDRLAILDALGWRIIRVSATLLYRRPHIVLDRVRAALRANGAPDLR